jgi:hypothetical protein
VTHPAIKALEHRALVHRAGLRAAKNLGWPEELAVSVADARVRLAEVQDCIIAVKTELARHHH